MFIQEPQQSPKHSNATQLLLSKAQRAYSRRLPAKAAAAGDAAERVLGEEEALLALAAVSPIGRQHLRVR